MSRMPDEDIIRAYKDTGSVWKTGKRLGMTGQTVHDRLRILHYDLAGQHWTDGELAELKSLYEANVNLGEIASRLGRTYAGVAVKASRLGIKIDQRREKKIPRGAGWDKKSVQRHMKALRIYDGKITQYARTHGLHVETLVRALQKYCLDEWKEYLNDSDVPKKKCPYCNGEFIPTSGKQKYCTRTCGNDARIDASYFGGKRKFTLGLSEGVCQLCHRSVSKGLSSHHLLGKENDPDNNHLIALCSGCHKTVTMLGGRVFVNDKTAWENLISLAWLRKHGNDMANDAMAGKTLHITVDIDIYEDPTEVQ